MIDITDATGSGLLRVRFCSNLEAIISCSSTGPRLWVETPPVSFYDSLSIPPPPTLPTQEVEVLEGDCDKMATEESDPSPEKDHGGEAQVLDGDLARVSSWAYYDEQEQVRGLCSLICFLFLLESHLSFTLKVDELIKFLNEEGPREKELKSNLERKYLKIGEAMKRPYSSHSQRTMIVPHYDLPVRRSSRLAGRQRPRR